MQIVWVPLISILLALLTGISFVFWRLWDTSQANSHKSIEAEQAARKQAIDNLERWVIGEANTAREYHDKDTEGTRSLITGQGREIGEMKRDIVELKRDTGNHRMVIAVIEKSLTTIESGIAEIKTSLKDDRRG